MSEFLFSRSQRVTVPINVAYAENVPGVVATTTGFIGREPAYGLQWQATHAVDENGNLETRTAIVSESELIKAQPPKMVPLADVEKARAEAYRQGGDDLREELAQEGKSRAAKRSKRKPARKSRK